MSSTDPSTVTGVLSWAAERLDSSGVTESRREALDIWSAVTHTDPVATLCRPEASVTPEHWSEFRSVVSRRAGGEPLVYTLGRVGFRTLELQVDRSTLMPRPETEGLVQQVLDWSRAERRTGPVADVGTGCGCIALSLAVEGGFDRVVATEISEHALAVAARNVELIEPPVDVDLRLGDLLTPLPAHLFDAVVSNPPYVSAAEFAGLDSSVRDFEPRRALVSGEDGLLHTRRLLETAARYMTDGGLIAVEVDAGRSREALRLAVQNEWHSPRIERDVFGRERYLLATRPPAPAQGPCDG